MPSAPWLPGEPQPDPPLRRPAWPGGVVTITAEPAPVREPRRITQLVGSTEGVHALCSDGTVWHLIGGVWCPKPGIPQRQVAEGEL